MSTRRQSRECAVQILFQVEFCPASLDDVLPEYWTAHEVEDPQVREFTERIVRGVIENREVIDQKIEAGADNWAIHRMARLDLCVLRLGVFELLYCDDIPTAVTLNEAVDLAKYFSSSESGRFVNGVLDRIRIEHSKRANVS